MKHFAQRFRRIRALLFDVDGTLVDSNSLHAEAWAKALRKYGHAFSTKDLMPWIGKGGDKILKEMAGLDDESVEGKAISAYRGELFKNDYAPLVRAFPGAPELLRELHQKGLKLALATSAKRDEMQAVLKASDLMAIGYVDRMTTSDDAEDSKPDPDIVKAALDKLGFAPEDAWMVGDTPYDIEAAEKAGIQTIALRTGGWDDAALNRALFIFDDAAAFLNEIRSLSV